MNRQKRFCFHEDIRKKCVSPTVVDYADTCQTNRWLCRHRVRVVNDYADTVNYLTFKNEKTSDKSNNKLNLILRKCLIFIVLDYTDPLRGHGGGIVVGYLCTPTVNFEGFSQILKEQSGDYADTRFFNLGIEYLCKNE